MESTESYSLSLEVNKTKNEACYSLKILLDWIEVG